MTGHLHTMVALATTAAFLLAAMSLEIRESRLSRVAIYLVISGELVMAASPYPVRFFGEVAHLLITPAALVLTATLILSFDLRKAELMDPEGALLWGLRLGNVWTRLFIAARGPWWL